MITVTGSLVHGIEKNGARHKDFELRAATIGDAVAAIEEAGADASFLRVKIHKIARCLVRLGDLKAGDVTAAMLMELPEEDFGPLNAALDDTEKKPSASAIS
jgi:hypothetical protein